MRDRRRAAADSPQDPFVSSPPVQILAEDVDCIPDEDARRLIGEAAEIVRHRRGLFPLVQMERITAAYGIGGDEIGRRDRGQERACLGCGKGIKPALQCRSPVQAALRAEHLLHDAHRGTGCSTSNL
jgi:hypothetical protein